MNGQWVQALNSEPGGFSAFDALVASGKEMAQFYGRPGLATSYTFNGVLRTERGGMGQPCKLYVNGAEATLDAELHNGDSLTFLDAVSGQDGLLSYNDALSKEGLGSGSIRFNGEERPLPVTLVKECSVVADLDAPLPYRARLEAQSSATLEQLLNQ